MTDEELAQAKRFSTRSARTATMLDVARTAGVSIKSVSRVINGEPHVSERLRARIEAAIAELDYVPDTAARSLAGSRNFIVGLLFDNPSPNYTIKLQAGVYRACIESGYHMRIDTIDSLQRDAAIRTELDRLLRHGRPDGFIVSPPLTDEPLVLDHLEHLGIPYVRIAPVTDPGRSPAVLIDDAGAAAAVAQLLWDQGHRRLAIVNGPALHGAAGTRRAGFLSRLNELNPDGVVLEEPGGFSFAGGIAAGRQLFSARRPPTGVFAANDDMAAGLMVACAEVGLKVPDDVSIVGFDDSWIAMSVWPYLTTIHQPIEEMGYAAARMLLDRHASQNAAQERYLDWRLVERDSAAPRK